MTVMKIKKGKNTEFATGGGSKNKHTHTNTFKSARHT